MMSSHASNFERLIRQLSVLKCDGNAGSFFTFFSFGKETPQLTCVRFLFSITVDPESYL